MSNWLVVSMLALASGATGEMDMTIDTLNVVWNSPSPDHHGSMPLGNGEIGLNAWMDRVGDLHFYISRTDSWSEGGHLLKVGKVRVSFEPNPLTDGAGFHQELTLKNGEINIRIDGKNPTDIGVWVDAHSPVIYVTAESAEPIRATARIELWRTEPLEMSGAPSDPYSPLLSEVQPDTVLTGQEGRVGWYHHNAASFGPLESMRYQGLDDYPGFVDPLLHRTFGAIVTAKGGSRVDDRTLTTEAATKQVVSVYSLAQHPSTPETWLAEMDRTIRETETSDLPARYRRHVEWWREFWDRSYVFITESDAKARGPSHPRNDLPLRVGVDQHGGSVFPGELGRVAIYGGAYDDAQVRTLFGCAQDSPGPAESVPIYSGFPGPNTELPDSAGWDAAAELTIEAWVKPGAPDVAGRIVDKITPGGSDGFLLDTYPGGRLRLIVGGTVLHAEEALPAGEWTHAAAVLAEGGIRLYRNGALVAQAGYDTDSDAEAVSRGYALQRFVNACAGRGRYPIKFNGSIFTVPYEGRPGDADYRQWGPGYWWQNTRLPYISMCASGDFVLLQPLFRMYLDEIFPLCEFRVRKYFGYDGAYFAECMHPWGAVFPDTYGHEAPWNEREDKLQSGGWHKWEWVAGPELVFMALDYCDYTGDEVFLRDKVLPAAESVARFFDNYYKTDERGKLVMHPAQAVETWWDVTNPMPELAGLRAVSERILALPDRALGERQREFWKTFYAKLPDIPLRETPDGPALAPGEEFAQKSNVENPELYAVFPFRLIAVGRPNTEWGVNALNHRWDRGAGGWRQDDIFMAYLGLSEEARRTVVQRARSHDAGSRFPAFWGPNYDWIPDQDHGGVLLKAVQSLLMQVDGRRIYLLPAWPDGWNADFKLHAPYGTVVRGNVRDGRVTNLEVTPKAREGDVVVLSHR